MHVRVLTVQRYKIQQDRKLLLACPGAPCVDIYGRRQPGPADTSPGAPFLLARAQAAGHCNLFTGLEGMVWN